MSNLISRQAILEHIEKKRQDALMVDDMRRASITMMGMDLLEEAVRNQPSTQLESEERIAKSEHAQMDLRSRSGASKMNRMNDLDSLNGSYINRVTVGNNTGIIRDTAAHDEIMELREMIERLKGKPYYMKIQCHNCGAPLVIESSNHLVKCEYCHTAYFSGTQLINLGI